MTDTKTPYRADLRAKWEALSIAERGHILSSAPAQPAGVGSFPFGGLSSKQLRLAAAALDVDQRDIARSDERIARLTEADGLLQGVVYQLSVLERYVRDQLDVPALAEACAVSESSVRFLQAMFGTAQMRLANIRSNRCPDCGHEINPDHLVDSGCIAIPTGGTDPSQFCSCILPPDPDALFRGGDKAWGGRPD